MTGHEKQWKLLTKNFESGKLAHAYLLVGPDGIGKKMFAEKFAEFLGCKFPDLEVVAEANTKDYKFGDGGEITIKQVRKVQEFLSYKSYNGGFKIVIVDEAEKMNQEAQSCFLKTLEEPKGQTIIFLVTSKPDMLLSTIISRCQTVKFFRPSNLPEDPEKLKEEKEILDQVLPIINSNLADKFKYVKSINFEAQSALKIIQVLQNYFRKQLLENLNDQKAKKFLELSQETINKLTFTNANQKLALEILLMEI